MSINDEARFVETGDEADDDAGIGGSTPVIFMRQIVILEQIKNHEILLLFGQ